MKRCSKCHEYKPSEAFHRNKNVSDGRNCWCAECVKIYQEHPAHKAQAKTRRRVRMNTSERAWKLDLIGDARRRARKKGLPCDLTIDAVHWPELCPVFGVPLVYASVRNGVHQPNSASFDQFVPGAGYTLKNTVVISWRANQVKRDATAVELRRVADFMDLYEKIK